MTNKVQSTKTFTETWFKKFEENVRAVAGIDGRLSLNEARRISQRSDANRLWGDNAVDYLEAKGQKSVSVAKLLEAGRAYAYANAVKAAGPDGRLSAADGLKLPADLRDDFIYLRTGVDQKIPTPAEVLPGVHDMAMRALDNGTATKLSSAPAEVRGLKPIEEGVAHDATQTRFSTWLAPSGEVYLSRASSTPSPLVGWYHVGTYGTEEAGWGKLRAQVESVTKGLWLSSEGDAHLAFVLAPHIDTEAIDEEMIRGKLGNAHDLLGQSIYGWTDVNFVPLAQRQLESVQDGNAWLDRRIHNFDPADPVSAQQAAKFAELKKVLNANLSGLQVFRFGTTNITVLLVGRTRGGDLAGLLSAVVET
jgi:hypothetical protein